MQKAFIMFGVLLLTAVQSRSQTFEYKESGTDFILYGLSVPQQNENVAYAGGSQYTTESSPGIIIRTTDAGESWQTVYSGDNIQSLDFVTPLKGFAGGYSPMLKMTEDGGDTWQDVNVSDNVYGFKIIKFYNENKGLALYITSDYGLEIGLTEDGGQTWTLSSNPPQHGILQISYADENTLFAVGYSRSIYKSEDGGDNWTLLESNGTDINLGVDFKDTLNGVYSGEEGDLYITHDGGNSWANTLNTGYHHFYGLKYMGDKILAVGTDEDVYLSNDNGENFEMIFNGSGDDQLYSISFFSDNSGLISGSGGTLIKFEDLFMSTADIQTRDTVIYPNPAKDILHIRTGSGADSISITDLSGRLILRLGKSRTETQIGLNGLKKGIYLINIDSGGKITTHKFIKN